jgi:hypothetical protein
MRKLLMSIATVGMCTAAPISLPTAAAAMPNPGMEFCKSVIGPPPQPKNQGNLGECTSLFTVPTVGGAAHICDFWAETGQLEDFGYDTFRDCLKAEQEFIRGG